MRLRMRVVFPQPVKPVRIVIGMRDAIVVSGSRMYVEVEDMYRTRVVAIGILGIVVVYRQGWPDPAWRRLRP